MTPTNKKSINEILLKKEYELIQRGIEKGKEEVMKKGIKEVKEEIAGNMIKEGIPIKQISRITRLQINEIKQLKPGK